MPRKKVGNSSEIPARIIDMKTGKAVDTSIPVLCRNIRRFREQFGWEQKELAERIGVTGNAVSNWENGRSRPDINLLPSLCDVLEVTLYDLLGLEGPSLQYTAGEQMLIDKYRDLTPGHKRAVDGLVDTLYDSQLTERKPPVVRELVYYDRPLSAGPGDPTEFEDEGIPIFLYASRLVDRADCVFSVNGNSMEPTYHDGDMVLISRIPDAPELQYGEVGAFISGNETYIKVCQEDGLHSLNPAYAPMKFGEDSNVYLIGRVIGILDPEQIAKEADVEKYLAMKATN